MYQVRTSVVTLLVAVFVLLLQSGCALFGIHLDVHNPSRAKKPPKFSESEILLGAMNRFRSCYDVHFYELDITLDPDRKTLKGQVVMEASATSDFDTIQMDLYEHMEIDRIQATNSNSTLKYYRKEGGIFVLMDNKVRKNDHFGIKVSYHGKPIKAKRPPWKGGFVWKKDKNNHPWIGVACESEGASSWFPCKDHTSDEADSVVMNYTVPSGLMAVGNGRHTGTKVSEDTLQKTYSWKVVNPINTYNITLYAGDLVLIKDTVQGQNGVIDLEHYVLSYHEEEARKHFRQVKPIIHFFEKAFGPYPWYEDGFSLVEAPYAGMEHQSAIAYGSGYKNFRMIDVDPIILHETAHEWWGNSVTASDFAHVWLQEGIATYAEAMYIENRDGHKDYLSYLFLQRIFIKNKSPLVWISDRRFFNYHLTDVYMKGSWVLHTLRNVMENDSLFFDILKTFCINNKAKLVTSEDFTDWVRKRTETDYSWFFDQYLYKRQAPILEYCIDWDDEDNVMYYRWKNADDRFKMPCEIKFFDKQLGHITLDIFPTKRVQKVSLSDILPNGSVQFDMLEKYYGTEETKKVKKMANRRK